MEILFNFMLIELFYNIVYLFFKKYNYHEIFRSFSCLIITFVSLFLLLNNYDNLYIEYTNDTIIKFNNFIIHFLIYDIFKLIYHKNTRNDLYIHHMITIYAYYIYGGVISLFCGLAEIYSSLNWLKFIDTDKKFNLVNEKFKFGTLFFRFIIWTIGCKIAYGYDNIGYRILSFPAIMIMDIYWFYKLSKILFNNKNTK